jgi:murein DD-endopeptidase MepM/ murein hydrolase activator NlpD
MKLFGAVVLAAAVAALCVAASAGAGRTFTVVPAAPAALPSYLEPNAPGSIAFPFALGTPPEHPVSLSYGELLALWHRAGEAYGVPWQVLAAINKIESNFGQNMGPSSAGAIGWMQFMPSTWERWGLDADGDGFANPWNPDDAILAAARYLAAAGAHDDLARGIFAYNHAQWYVDEVLALAAQFDSGNVDFVPGLGQPDDAFRFDALQVQLVAARQALVRAQRSAPRIERGLAALDRKKLVLTRRAGDPTLSARAFEQLERRIVRIEQAQDRSAERLAAAKAALAAAVARVESLRAEVAGAAVASPTTAALDAGQSVDGYVFPVGGGPASVSVGHHHHDYPAADIAAPEGAPLYALADSVVADTYDGGNCGIGLRLLLSNGVSYTYCHLSYREPDVIQGAALAAGAPVGLVGETGHATGPHLHLQLNPPDRYPQLEPWFQAFAGVAFSWQDAPTPKVAPKVAASTLRGGANTRAGRVFSVVSRTPTPSGTRVVTFTR